MSASPAKSTAAHSDADAQESAVTLPLGPSMLAGDDQALPLYVTALVPSEAMQNDALGQESRLRAWPASTGAGALQALPL